jgi:predicted transposase YbfD/YdcC
VLAVKSNQASLHRDPKLFFKDGLEEGFDVAVQECASDDWGHGRSENRKCWVAAVEQLEWFKHTKKWKGLRSIACVQSTRRSGDGESVENRYFISSLENVKSIARAVGHHWSVENKCHWVMDVNFAEDACRVRKDYAPENFALLRQVAHNLIKQQPSKGISVRRRMRIAGYDTDFLTKMLVGL